jgi:type IV pilus assembly protein PilX
VTRNAPIRAGRQQGMVLAVSLIILLALMIIGASSMRSVLFEERMAGNAKQQYRSFQSAEMALRAAEREITLGASGVETSPTACDEDVVPTLGDDEFTNVAMGAESSDEDESSDEVVPQFHYRYCLAASREYRKDSGEASCSDAGAEACVMTYYYRVLGVGRVPGNSETALLSTFAVTR